MAYEMTDELQDLVGQRIKHTTLGAHGEVVKVSVIYDEVIVEIAFDNGACQRYTLDQYAEHIELAPLRKNM